MIICQQDPVGTVLLAHKEETTYCFLYLRKKLIKIIWSHISFMKWDWVTLLHSVKELWVSLLSLLHPNNSKVKSTLEGALLSWLVKCESIDEGSRLCKFHSPAWLQLTVLSPTSNVHANVLAYTHIHKTLPLCRNLCSWRLGHPGRDKIATWATIPSFQKNDNICKTTPKWPWTSPCRLLGSFIRKWCYKKMFCLIECQIN